MSVSLLTNNIPLIGALSKQYYKDAWQLVRSKAGLHDGEAGKNLIVLVFCAGNAEKWSRANLADAFPGAKVKRCNHWRLHISNKYLYLYPLLRTLAFSTDFH